MFEKEAEEYVMREDVITENDRVPFDNGYGFQTVSFEDEVKKGFQEGAEFGYNKANKWNFTHRNKEHLVVDCPKGKENKLYLLLLDSRDSKEYEFGRKVPVVCYWNEEWSRFERLEHTIGERNVNQNNINAWKEIVLPEEIKEND